MADGVGDEGGEFGQIAVLESKDMVSMDEQGQGENVKKIPNVLQHESTREDTN